MPRVYLSIINIEYKRKHQFIAICLTISISRRGSRQSTTGRGLRPKNTHESNLGVGAVLSLYSAIRGFHEIHGGAVSASHAWSVWSIIGGSLIPTHHDFITVLRLFDVVSQSVARTTTASIARP